MTDTEIRRQIEDFESLKVGISTRDYIELIAFLKELRWEVAKRDEDIDTLKKRIVELESKEEE